MDALIPHGPVISQAAVEYMAAGVVRDISKQIRDEAVKTQVRSIGKDMATAASVGMVQGWQDGDDLCPPWRPFPFPGPFPWPWVDGSIFGPQPKPWKERLGLPVPWIVASIEHLALADLLVSLAEVTANPDISARLKDASVVLAKGAVCNVVADLEGTAIKPRAAGAQGQSGISCKPSSQSWYRSLSSAVR